MTGPRTASLRISDTLALPIDAATQTFGILATKGAGKSNAAVVLAEAMWDAGVPWVAIDPKGDWWGMRSSADGQGAGLPIVVFGGRHGDLPLEPTAGQFVAALVLERRLTCVLDVSQFNKAEQVRFLLAFGQHLFKHADDDAPEPLHLFLEEAHEYLPQQVSGDVAHLVGAWQRIVKQGRFKGLGVTMISQRSQALNKDVLELVDTLIVMKTVGPRGRDAIKQWVKDQDVDPGLLASLPTLTAGEAWVWSPGSLDLMQRIRFLRRRTFDSGATPKVGEARRPPATLADVDLGELKDLMAETIERAQADDPKVLRRRIADLERQLATRPATEVVHEVEVREIPVIPETTQFLMTELAAQLIKIADHVRDFRGTAGSTPPRAAGEGVARKAPTPPASPAAPSRPERAAPAPTPRGMPADSKLGRAERAVLTVLVQFPAGRTHAQLALLAGYSAKASTIGVAVSKLRRLGYVADGQPFRATDAGIDALGDFEPLPRGQALLDYWRSQVGKAERLVLDHLIARYPESCTHAELADATGYKATASTIGVAMSKLRRLELVAGWAASDDFMDSIR